MVAATAMGCATDALDAPTASSEPPIVGGAGYLTYDAVKGGCVNADAVQCNTYASMDQVFMAGGPSDPTGLADGTYFFAVLAPDSQLATFLDEVGDARQRRFTVVDHEITSFDGAHIGQTPNGRLAVGLAPFDLDPGGVYVLAICAAGATDPSECTYDAFRIRAEDPGAALPILHGGAYYDANLNGAWDAIEPGLASWPIDYHDMISSTVETGADGAFALELIPDGYLLVARQPHGGVWQPTRTLDATRAEGGARASLEADSSYWIEVADQQAVHGVAFGFVCIGAGGAPALDPASCPAPTF